MADRRTLHISKLEAFKEWLKNDGWELLPLSKNPYEVLRAKKQGKQNPLIIYSKADTKEHLTVADRDYPVVRAFLGDSKKPKTNADHIRAMRDKELAAFLNTLFVEGQIEALHEQYPNSVFNREDSSLKWLQSEVEQ